MAATRNDNNFNVGKLVVKGANNLRECLEYAQRENKPHACAMLLMINAAMTGDKSVVQRLFGQTMDQSPEFADPGFPEVQKAVLSGKVTTVVPVEIARRSGHFEVREELLLGTDVNQEEGYVYWHGLRLLKLEVSWLRMITWVKRLRLARNGLKTLPNEIGNYLKQVSIIERCMLALVELDYYCSYYLNGACWVIPMSSLFIARHRLVVYFRNFFNNLFKTLKLIANSEAFNICYVNI